MLLSNATIVEWTIPRLRRGQIQIEGDRIVAVLDPGTPLPPDSETVDCADLLVLPGHVCAHHHLYSALARGMPGPAEPPTNFRQILERVWWRLDRALDAETIRLSALVGALEAARAGTTCLFDHHASPNLIDGSLDLVADALARVGLRGAVCYETSDRHGLDGARAGIAENRRFLMNNRRPLIRGHVGAHAAFTLGEESLAGCVDLARQTGAGIHIHVAEDAVDQRDSLERYGERVGQRLQRTGVLGPRTLVSHCVHLDDGEVGLIRDSHSLVLHNPRSNANNSVGYARPLRFGRVALGTDGLDGDMYAESRFAFYRAREESVLTGAEAVAGMMAAGLAAAGDLFGQPVGPLEPGAAADLQLVRYPNPTALTAGNLPWHLAFGMDRQQVAHVLVAGRWVVRDGVPVNVDAEQVYAQARAAAPKLWERMGEF